MRDGHVLHDHPRTAVEDAETSPLIEVVRVHVGGKEQRGVVAKRDIAAGTMLCQYRGEHREQNDFEDSTYVLAGRGPGGKPVFINGDTATLAANVNYAPAQHANAHFAEHGTGEQASGTWVVASRDIPRGQELRIDYDGNRGQGPYRASMIAKGVATAAQLDDPAFLRRRYK